MECLRADQRVKNFSGAVHVGSARLYAVPALAQSHFCFFVIIDPLFLLLKEVEYYFFETLSVIIQCATKIWLK